jgi:hypothetical protein
MLTNKLFSEQASFSIALEYYRNSVILLSNLTLQSDDMVAEASCVDFVGLQIINEFKFIHIPFVFYC